MCAGVIPKELGGLNKLQKLYLHTNELVGKGRKVTHELLLRFPISLQNSIPHMKSPVKQLFFCRTRGRYTFFDRLSIEAWDTVLLLEPIHTDDIIDTSHGNVTASVPLEREFFFYPPPRLSNLRDLRALINLAWPARAGGRGGKGARPWKQDFVPLCSNSCCQ